MNCLQLAQLRLPTCTCTCSLTGQTLPCMGDSHSRLPTCTCTCSLTGQTLTCMVDSHSRLPTCTCTCTCSLSGQTITSMVDSHGYNVMVIRALRVWCCGILLWNTVNYSTVVDQSDYSISTILYNFISPKLAYNY